MKSMMLAALLLTSSVALAEQVVLTDGTVVRGELVDFQNGVYTVKVGKFIKAIPESRIADVRPDSATTSSAPVAAPAQPAPGAAVAPGGPGYAPAPGNPGVAGLPGLPPGLSAPGGMSVNPAQVQDTLKQFGAGDPAVASAVQKMMGGGTLDPSSLSELQNNPAMEKLVERFRDPNYQRQLIEGLSNMQDQQHPGQHNPMVDQLQGLFQQLNSMQGQQGGAGH